jgi:transposase
MSRLGRKPVPLGLSQRERTQIKAMIRNRQSTKRLRLRCRIVLASADGLANAQIAAKFGTSKVTVTQWRKRFLVSGIDGLRDRPGRGRVAKPVPGLELRAGEREKLTLLAARPTASQRTAQRARIVLASADGQTAAQVAESLSVSTASVYKWRRRFAKDRLASLTDAARPGAPRRISDQQVEDVVTRTLESTPQNATHWSTRSMAEATGLTQNAIWRIWRVFGLQPHRQDTFKLSTDPFFIEKVRDVVGLYMNPPEHALVLCVDEKSQVQALDRTQPLLPIRPGFPEQRTHDYYRHGTTSLFAALEVASGEVVGRCYRQHRHQEFLRFLRVIDREFPNDIELHLILDNYGTHKTPEIQRWLIRHPRFQLHFIPTSSSWLNQVELWFAQITKRRIRRGSFNAVRELEKAIMDYIENHNRNPKPFVWTATADIIFNKIKTICERI